MNILLNLFFLAIIFPSEFEDKQYQKIYSKIIDYEKTNKTFELLLRNGQKVYVADIEQINTDNIIINILIDRRLSTYRDVKSLMNEEIEGSYPKLYRKIYFKNIIDINKITSKPNFFYKSPDLSNNYIISISLITLLVLRIIF